MSGHPDPLDFSLSGITLRIDSDRSLTVTEEFRPFLRHLSNTDFLIRFRQTQTLPTYPQTVIHEDHCYRVHPDGKGGYIRTFFDAPRDLTPYAVAVYDYDGGKIQVDYLPKGAHCVSELCNSFFHLGLEALLIHRDRLCLHASCVETSMGGILFSGPSGIGKSTQADLWCRLRGAEQLNGDRPILSKEDGHWLAWGSPYAGSSRVHVNRSCSVRAIVMLKQDTQCTLRRLPLPEAFRAVWSGLTLHSWNEKLVELASDLTLALIGDVPVFELSCTPDEAAVSCLERALKKECGL